MKSNYWQHHLQNITQRNPEKWNILEKIVLHNVANICHLVLLLVAFLVIVLLRIAVIHACHCYSISR